MLHKVRTLLLASLLVTGGLALGASPSSATETAPFNPNLTEACGLDFVLVLDRSGSIEDADGDGDLEGAATSFLDAMKDTGSKAAIVSFAATASVDWPATPVTSGANLTALKGAVTGLSYGGSTNWQDGLTKAQGAFAGLDHPLVIVITDGDPNKYYSGNNLVGPGSGFDTAAFNAAKTVAADIKGTAGSPGSHIFAIGVGDVNVAGLKGISGNDEWNGSNFGSADWAKTNFASLGEALHDIATDLCGGTITVTKKVGDSVMQDWPFTANGQDLSTGEDGTAQFSFDNEQPLEVSLTEGDVDGYALAGTSCSVNTTAVDNGVKLTLGPEDKVTCTFTNRVLGADIEVAKAASASTVRAGTDVTYTYTVTTGDGDVALGEVQVSDDKCADVAYVAGDTDSDNILDLGETWTYQCTSAIDEDTTNIATASGQPPVGGRVSDQAQASVDVVNPALQIDKSGPALAHEGDQIEYTITVTNTGDVPLFNLVVSDDLLDWSQVIGELPAGEDNSVSFTVPYVVPAGSESIENTAEVCPEQLEARADFFLPDCDSDGHTVDVIHPAITIDKTANPVSITGSGEVTYTYAVENTGDVTLSNVVVTDDVLGAIGTIPSLAAHAKVTLAKTVTVGLASPTRNVGTATGSDPLGKSVSDDDDAVITIVAGQTTTQDPPVTTASPAPTSVLGETLVQPEATLPRTGAEVGLMGLAGLGLLGGGIGFRFAGRRRRNKES